MSPYKLSINYLGDQFLIIEGPTQIDPDLTDYLRQFGEHLQAHLQGLIFNINLTYSSLCLQYDEDKISYKFLRKKIIKHQNTFNFIKNNSLTLWNIPVCYHPDLATDLLDFCKHKNLPVEKLIELHTAPNYKIHFLGFLPGFPYLGGLNEQLHHPRKKQPRSIVPAGAVGIGGEQTGIYPHASPGGWQLIGQTPLTIFNPSHHPPALFKAGDYLRFSSITIDEYQTLKFKFADTNYKHKPSTIPA